MVIGFVRWQLKKTAYSKKSAWHTKTKVILFIHLSVELTLLIARFLITIWHCFGSTLTQNLPKLFYVNLKVLVWVYNQRQYDFTGQNKSSLLPFARCQNVKCDKNQSKWTVVNNHHLFFKRKVIQLDAKQQFKPPQIPRYINYWENIELLNTLPKLCNLIFSR